MCIHGIDVLTNHRNGGMVRSQKVTRAIDTNEGNDTQYRHQALGVLSSSPRLTVSTAHLSVQNSYALSDDATSWCTIDNQFDFTAR
ncbi:hypothetical protein V3C99_008263 [Haemonchus contortus]